MTCRSWFMGVCNNSKVYWHQSDCIDRFANNGRSVWRSVRALFSGDVVGHLQLRARAPHSHHRRSCPLPCPSCGCGQHFHTRPASTEVRHEISARSVMGYEANMRFVISCFSWQQITLICQTISACWSVAFWLPTPEVGSFFLVIDQM